MSEASRLVECESLKEVFALATKLAEPTALPFIDSFRSLAQSVGAQFCIREAEADTTDGRTSQGYTLRVRDDEGTEHGVFFIVDADRITGVGKLNEDTSYD